MTVDEKNFSRSGATSQRGIAKLAFFRRAAAPLREYFFVPVANNSRIYAAQNVRASIPTDRSGYTVITATNFSEFDAINLNAKRVRYLAPAGLRTRTTFHRYKTLIVKRDNFTFTTMTVRGVFYTFSGKFLEGRCLWRRKFRRRDSGS